MKKVKVFTTLFVLGMLTTLVGCDKGESSSLVPSSESNPTSSSESSQLSNSSSESLSQASSSELSSSSSSEEIPTIPAGAFVVDESKVDTIPFGESYTIPAVNVIDSLGQNHVAQVSITDPFGDDVEFEDNVFIPLFTGEYSISYTVKVGVSEESKSYTVVVEDNEAPVLSTDCPFAAENLIALGSTVDLNKLVFEDNYDEEVEPSFTVTFNNIPVDLDDNTFIADEVGTYVIEAEASDSEGNTSSESIFTVSTLINAELGNIGSSAWYPGSASEERAIHGDKSIKYGWFDNHFPYVNDFGLLGADVGIIEDYNNYDEEENPLYLSFWIYFDTNAVGIKSADCIAKYIRYETSVYDQYGIDCPGYWQVDGGYALSNNCWYHMYLNLCNATNSAPEGENCNSNPTNFSQIAFGFGIWDLIAGGNADASTPVYIDDIKLETSLYDEEYMEEFQLTSPKNEHKMFVGDTRTLEVSSTVMGYDSVIWTSADESIATVSPSGEVSCVGVGQTTITATSLYDRLIKLNFKIYSYDPLSDKNYYAGEANKIKYSDIYSNQFKNVGSYFDMLEGKVSVNFAKVDLTDPTALVITQLTSDDNSGDDSLTYPHVTNWKYWFGKNTGFVYCIKANEPVFVGMGDELAENGYISGKSWAIKVDSQGTKTVLRDGLDLDKGHVGIDPVLLETGDIFYFIIGYTGNDIRNMSEPVYVSVSKVEIFDGCEEHTFSTEWSKDDVGHWHIATCKHTDQIGNYGYHTYGPWKVTTPATDTEFGVKERECTVCGHKESKVTPTSVDETGITNFTVGETQRYWYRGDNSKYRPSMWLGQKENIGKEFDSEDHLISMNLLYSNDATNPLTMTTNQFTAEDFGSSSKPGRDIVPLLDSWKIYFKGQAFVLKVTANAHIFVDHNSSNIIKNTLEGASDTTGWISGSTLSVVREDANGGREYVLDKKTINSDDGNLVSCDYIEMHDGESLYFVMRNTLSSHNWAYGPTITYGRAIENTGPGKVHECEHVCPFCNKCYDPFCKEDACSEKCNCNLKPDSSTEKPVNYQWGMYNPSINNGFAYFNPNTADVSYSNKVLFKMGKCTGLTFADLELDDFASETEFKKKTNTWQLFTAEVGVAYHIKALEDVFVRFDNGSGTKFNGWLNGTVMYCKVGLDGKLTLIDEDELSANTLIHDYIQLRAGEELISCYISPSGNNYNIQNPPRIFVAPAILGD